MAEGLEIKPLALNLEMLIYLRIQHAANPMKSTPFIKKLMKEGIDFLDWGSFINGPLPRQDRWNMDETRMYFKVKGQIVGTWVIDIQLSTGGIKLIGEKPGLLSLSIEEHEFAWDEISTLGYDKGKGLFEDNAVTTNLFSMHHFPSEEFFSFVYFTLCDMSIQSNIIANGSIPFMEKGVPPGTIISQGVSKDWGMNGYPLPSYIEKLKNNC